MRSIAQVAEIVIFRPYRFRKNLRSTTQALEILAYQALHVWEQLAFDCTGWGDPRLFRFYRLCQNVRSTRRHFRFTGLIVVSTTCVRLHRLQRLSLVQRRESRASCLTDLGKTFILKQLTNC